MMKKKFFIFLGIILYSSPAVAGYPYKPFACDVTVKLDNYSQYKDEKDKKIHSIAKIEIVKINKDYTAINVEKELYGTKKACEDFKIGEIVKISDFENRDTIITLEQGIVLRGTLSLIKSNPKLGYRFYNIEQVSK